MIAKTNASISTQSQVSYFSSNKIVQIEKYKTSNSVHLIYEFPQPKLILERRSISRLNENVDIAFMIEATSRNRRNIKSLSNNLFSLVKEVKKEFKTAIVRVAVVAYRDYSDEGRHFKVNDFTTDMNHIQTFLSEIKSTKRKSGNEDVLGAIGESLRLDWKSSNKLLYQIST